MYQQLQEKCIRTSSTTEENVLGVVVLPPWLKIMQMYNGKFHPEELLREMKDLCFEERLSVAGAQGSSKHVEETLDQVNRLRWSTGFLMILLHRTKTQIDKTMIENMQRIRSEKYYSESSEASSLTHAASDYISGDRWMTMCFELAYTSRECQAFQQGTLWSERFQKMGTKWGEKVATNNHWIFFLDRDRQGEENWGRVAAMMGGGRRKTTTKKKTKKGGRNDKCSGCGRKNKSCKC